ncbi:UNVERIFIED_CONTAM: hypothetical protein GTU68_043838 [Idotea baltica]|nr:hypothetical protein [Idotea baltica]
MSPMTYLRLLRLNRVRDVLADASPDTTSVTAIAMDHGFLHLGRFARDYKRLFDQSPSATLGQRPENTDLQGLPIAPGFAEIG